jgi:hypothetical protein
MRCPTVSPAPWVNQSVRYTVIICAALCMVPLALAVAAPTITVISPVAGSDSGSPVFYEAYATSTCVNGIDTMRIYSAPGVDAYTSSGQHIETFIPLAPGTYSTVVQVWDNCGNVSKTTVNITVSSTPGISIFLPSGKTAAMPFHFAASVQNSTCSAGIKAMRIYTAGGTSPYTVLANSLDTFVNLPSGTYSPTVQAWDNCGNVFRANLELSNSGGGDAYLYVSNADQNAVALFNISNGVISNPNGSGDPPLFTYGTGAIAVDPGSWFTYVLSVDSTDGSSIIESAEINQLNGYPNGFGGENEVFGTNANDIAIDPNGNFLFIVVDNTLGVYQIDRSSGWLTYKQGYPASGGLYSVTVDFTGQYVYAMNNNFDSAEIWGYKINQDNGALTAVPGSPYTVDSGVASSGVALASTMIGGPASIYLYAATEAAGYPLVGYAVDYTTGALTEVPGYPGDFDQLIRSQQGMIADIHSNWIWGTAQAPTVPPQNWFDVAGLNSNGSLSSKSEDVEPANMGMYVLTQDGSVSESYLYAGGWSGICPSTCTGGVTSWTISSDGDLTLLSGPLNTGSQTGQVYGIGVARKSGD